MGRTTTSLLATALLLAGGFSAADAAKVCKSLHKVTRPFAHPTEAIARADAATSWSMQVAVKYTPKFANWGNAASRKYTCSKKTSPLGANMYRCNAQAKPCAYE